MKIDELKLACRLCKAAYDPPDHSVVFQVRTARAIAMRVGRFMWIAVEGTRPSLLDWLKNLWTIQTDFYGFKAHSGCAWEANLLLSLITDHFREFNGEFKIVGHSQGGGVAPLLAIALRNEGFRIAGGYTLAPMRSLLKKSSARFNEEFAGRWDAVSEEFDIVPHAPPKVRYGDTGKRWLITSDGKLTEAFPPPAEYICKVVGLLSRGEGKLTWKKHDLDVFQAHIEAM